MDDIEARLRELRVILKSGDYDGADLMHAWCAMIDAADTIASLRALVVRSGEFACKAPQFDWNEDRCVMTAVHLAEDCRTALASIGESHDT